MTVAGQIRHDEPMRGHPETAILTREQMMEWFQVGEKPFNDLDVPYFMAGGRRRYLVAHVLKWLDTKAMHPSGREYHDTAP